MRRLLFSFVAAIMVVLPAQADGEVSGDDAVAIRDVIERQLDAFKRMVEDFSRHEQMALFHDNAARFYRLGEAEARGPG